VPIRPPTCRRPAVLLLGAILLIAPAAAALAAAAPARRPTPAPTPKPTPRTSTVPPPRAATPSTTASLKIDADLSFFFPPQRLAGNAAEAYTRAFTLYNIDRDRTKYGEQWDVQLQRPIIQRMLDHVTSGALHKTADFLPFLPDDLARQTKFPYLGETHGLARLLDARSERALARGARDEALRDARALMAFGRHLRESALVLSQELQGVTIERLAARRFRALLGDANPLARAKLDAIEGSLNVAQTFIADVTTSHALAGRGLKADLAWLSSPIPVLRTEAIINMAHAVLPPDVLLKPTPRIDALELLAKYEEATTETRRQMRVDQFKRAVPWPRRGVLDGFDPKDILLLRKVLSVSARSDPDRRVRALAQRLLDALEVPPAATPAPPPPPAAGRPTAPPHRPPAPRPR